ncbi:U3 small nucleolar RNA-associated protein 7 [Nematocida homosporus]|uniref:U3 small nucleolar RNA-associated protein 7 n=1 Tax=Nematocida homosporus TaxID=1912981 RepID=UPI00222111F8|nr:U3 small nucleolar RNA-associated protein 7 [Nematocida homosporus]KAI5187582.1 U3 small nucleolar RNA-associated protein 7 [Nematocida homosporus]
MTLRRQQEDIARRLAVKDTALKTKHMYDILSTGKIGNIIGGHRDLKYEEFKSQIDIGTLDKTYKLNLGEGPFKAAYTPSGDAVLYFGGNQANLIGTADLNVTAELKVGDTVHDGTFLHSAGYFALAQTGGLYIYRRDGVELHVLREHVAVRRVCFLQDHFLLCSLSEHGQLRYQDTTVGKLVSDISTKARVPVLTHDRTNGVVFTGNRNGVVSLWSPRTSEALAKVLCHRGKISNIKTSGCGQYMYTTAGLELACWDMRNTFSPVQKVSLLGPAADLAVSDTRKVAVGLRGVVHLFDSEGVKEMEHSLGRNKVGGVTFMPYEDILAIGTTQGIENIVVPGAGALEYRRDENPWVSRAAKRESEVRRMLEKIPGDMISLDSEIATEMREVFTEEIVPMKLETPAGKVRRLMRRHYG